MGAYSRGCIALFGLVCAESEPFAPGFGPFCLFVFKNGQVKFLLSTQIQNSPPLVPGAGSLRRRQNLNHPGQGNRGLVACGIWWSDWWCVCVRPWVWMRAPLVCCLEFSLVSAESRATGRSTIKYPLISNLDMAGLLSKPRYKNR